MFFGRGHSVMSLLRKTANDSVTGNSLFKCWSGFHAQMHLEN